MPKAINVLLVSLHTSTLDSKQFSVNTIFYVYIAYLNILLTYGMETAFFRFYNTEKDKNVVVSTAFISILSTTFIALITMLIFANPIAEFMGFQDPIFFKLMISVAILDTLVVIPFAYLRVTGKSITYTAYKLASILIIAVFNVYFLWYMPQNQSLNWFDPGYEEGYIFVANLIACVFVFLGVLPVMRKFKWAFNRKLLKKMLSYAWPVLVAGIAYITNENMDKLVLEDLVGKSQMGAYAGAYKIGVIMTLYITAFRLGAEPFFFNQAKEKNAPQTYALITKWFSILGTLFLIGIVVFIDPIAGIFLRSEEYFSALGIVPIILAANLFLGIYNNLSIWYKVTDKTKYGMYISSAGAILTVVLLFTTIPKYGYMAAAWTTMFVYGLMMLASYLLGQKQYKIPYDIQKIGLYLILGITMSFVKYYYFPEAILLGIVFILGYLITIFLMERKNVQAIIKRL